MNYFVTLNGIDYATNLNKKQAIDSGKKLMNNKSELGTLNIGIGKYKQVMGKKVYTLLPLHFLLD